MELQEIQHSHYLPSTGGYDITSAKAILGGTLQLVLEENVRIPNGITIPSDANIKVSTINKGFLKSVNSFLINGILDIGVATISNPTGEVILSGTIKTSKDKGLYGTGANISSGLIFT